MNAMLDFVCMGSIDLPGARRKRQNTKLKILIHSWTRKLHSHQTADQPTTNADQFLWLGRV